MLDRLPSAGLRPLPALALPALALLALLTLPGLGGCAGLPDSAMDASVTGRLSLEFPDGFLGLPARTVDSNLLLHFQNLTTGKRFLRAAWKGSFSFPAVGGQAYRLLRYEYSYREQLFFCYLSDSVGVDFRPEPGNRLAAGAVRIRYTRPRPTSRPTFARSELHENDGEREGKPPMVLVSRTYWRYDKDIMP